MIKMRIGGDFNACIELIDGDDLALLQHVGPIGMGQRNARGTMFEFYIFNRDGSLQRDESWTCRRAYDATCVQLDFIIGDAYFTLKKAWQDYCIPIGNDHRCVMVRPLHLIPQAAIQTTISTQTGVEGVETNHG